MAIVYLNGEFIAEEQAVVSVFDRGFLFGDGIYEVIPAYGSHLFRLSEHIARLERSLQAVSITNPYSNERWQEIISHVVAVNEGLDQSIYLQITRGVAERNHRFPANTQPSVFAFSRALKPLSDDELKHTSVVTCADNRWQRCDIKAISLLPNVLLRQQAVDVGATEAILIRDGKITEGAASNIFIVKDDILITPPKSNFLLPGVTRDLVVELADIHNISCQQRDVSVPELEAADEIWLSSSTKEILPVRKLNDMEIGETCPGPMWHKMRQHFDDYKAEIRG